MLDYTKLNKRKLYKSIACKIVILIVAYALFRYFTAYSKILKFKNGGLVDCSIAYDTYGVSIKNDFICSKNIDKTDYGNLLAITVEDPNTSNFAFISNEIIPDSVFAQRRQKQELIKEKTVRFHDRDLEIKFFGREDSTDGQAGAYINTGFYYRMDETYIYVHEFGPSLKLSGSLLDITEDKYEEQLIHEIMEFLDSAILFDE